MKFIINSGPQLTSENVGFKIDIKSRQLLCDLLHQWLNLLPSAAYNAIEYITVTPTTSPRPGVGPHTAVEIRVGLTETYGRFTLVTGFLAQDKRAWRASSNLVFPYIENLGIKLPSDKKEFFQQLTKSLILDLEREEEGFYVAKKNVRWLIDELEK